MFRTFWRATSLIAFANADAPGLQFLTTILMARHFGTSQAMTPTLSPFPFPNPFNIF